ncbi:protein-lysine N-methyltransferase EEF2KMT [Caerostris darwini]|uniref:Protein-lysine N-methyltransferase EEF2KMT n=1 Tax=Caerostris darwini TaxID=1538125 RepID=A0AAV4QEU6_9ARAC|nr:protein-lysine N-methyltransferase EEF2KMT [Caerostris darwini]
MQYILELIEKIYLSVTKNKKILLSCFKNEVLELLKIDVQEKILEVTIQNQLCISYPPPLSFQKFFLRCLYDCVENFGSECSNGLANAYADILAIQDTDRIGYHSYKIDGSCTITLQEDSHFVTKSTTGLQTWEAAKYLSEWCIRNTSTLEKKTVLELGSGIGLLGIIVLKYSKPEKYIFTDKSWEVLKLLSSNIKINIPNPENSGIQQKQLLWADINDKDAATLSPDIILGTGTLIQALKKLMFKKSSCAYIASTIRNPETNDKFLEQLGSSGLSYEILKNHEKSLFIYDESSVFMLYKIFK